MNRAGLLSVRLVAMLLFPAGLLGQGSEGFLGGGDDLPGSAVDANGRRHTEPAHSSALSPWMKDRVKSVAPYYPIEDRRLHHTGLGWFRIYLDLNSGAVSRVLVLHSTGFVTLDNSVSSTLRQWRWRPGKWKEIDLPVKFVIGRPPATLPPGVVRLPPH
jgi:TonB family protein